MCRGSRASHSEHERDVIFYRFAIRSAPLYIAIRIYIFAAQQLFIERITIIHFLFIAPRYITVDR